ncbi:hypothetical protein CARUB_v100039372mg, partial [Capsella rubella]
YAPATQLWRGRLH